MPPSKLRVALAFAAVYLIWGSTYLAISVAVKSLPPLLMAGFRHTVAGAVLYTWARTTGSAGPSPTDWRGTALVGTLLLLGGNGGVCWAQQTVPSGVAALLVTTVPVWMVLINWLRPGGIRPTAGELLGIALGFSGVAILVSGRLSGTQGVDWAGAAVLVAAAFFWAAGSIWSRHLKLPESPILVTGMEMLSGGALLLLSGLLLGEGPRVALGNVSGRSVFALGYLVVFGSLIGYTAYVWLLRVSTPAKVSTYAFVNPAVAVLLGSLVAHESLTPRILVACLVSISGVALITLCKASKVSA